MCCLKQSFSWGFYVFNICGLIWRNTAYWIFFLPQHYCLANSYFGLERTSKESMFATVEKWLLLMPGSWYQLFKPLSLILIRKLKQKVLPLQLIWDLIWIQIPNWTHLSACVGGVFYTCQYQYCFSDRGESSALTDIRMSVSTFKH